ncbi:MAG: hypothetical protein JST39_10740 [Bacteroidetes bacterium]|nr:hypothetical protein [Bacteroidota bacterium]
MQNTLNHLTPSQHEELSLAISKIAEATQAEKIYCYGSRHSDKTAWSLFSTHIEGKHEPAFTCYDLLLVMPDNDSRYRERVEDLARRPVTNNTLFYYRAFTRFGFTNLLKNGNVFIHKVYSEGWLLHNAHPESLFDRKDAYRPNANPPIFHWVKDINLARRLYGMAERAVLRNDRWEALAHLEESACYACTALIALYMGHPQKREPLSRLLQYCDNFCTLRSRIFPCNTPEETQLFQYLELVTTMEEKDYNNHIPMHAVEALLKRVQKLLELAGHLYEQKTGVNPRKFRQVQQNRNDGNSTQMTISAR